MRRRQELEERARKRKRSAMIYFTCIFLAITLLAFAGIHGSGVSLSSISKALSSSSTSTPEAAYPMPKGTPLFADPFVNDLSGWNLHSLHHNYAVSVGNGALTLEMDKNKLLWELLPGQRSYSNFTLTVNAALTKGDQNNGYGIYIRGTANPKSDLATYYRFELYGDGSYAIFKGVVDQSGQSSAVKLANYTLSPTISKAGKVNRIMIIAKGASLSFVVKGQLLQTVSDASYSSGSIALFVSNLPQAHPGAQAQFSQLAIYPA
jgi:hypothetical protein